MRMTRKHFEMIALALMDARADKWIIKGIVAFLKTTNERFDEERFLVASGYYKKRR